MKVYDNNKIKTYRSLFELTNSNVLVGRKDGLTIGIDENTIQELRDTIDTNNSLKYEVNRLNNIIKHIYKELREFDVCNNMGVAMQISYLEEYIQKNIEQIEDKYLQELKEGK
jgi:hypothetical protein